MKKKDEGRDKGKEEMKRKRSDEGKEEMKRKEGR